MKLFRLFVVACILTFCAGRAAAQEQETPAPKTYKIYAVCDAHLDTQWNWDLTHTIREYIRASSSRTSGCWSGIPITSSISRAASSTDG